MLTKGYGSYGERGVVRTLSVWMALALVLFASTGSSLLAQFATPASPPSQCPPVVHATTLGLALECINDLVFMQTAKRDSDWQYTHDSLQDAVEVSTVGGQYEIHGIALREFPWEVWVVINGNVPIEGHKYSRSQDGILAYGDLFFDPKGENFLEASNNSSLYAVRFSSTNNSGAPQVGVYSQVSAKSVTSINNGMSTLAAYEKHLHNLKGVLGYGDLPADQKYYASTISLNVIDKGTYVGPITFLTPEELVGAGYDAAQFAGKYTIAFKFNKRLISDFCGADGISCIDCKGVACGESVVDECNICGGNGLGCQGCDGIANSGKVVDACGICGGDGMSCRDCKGIPFGEAKYDACGVCGGDGSVCKDCAGQINGNAALDACKVCGGFGTSCLGCDGALNSNKVIDACGVCGGDSSSCKDCAGIPNGGAVVDACGVCGGDNHTCLDCNGVPNGPAKVDACGICNGTVSAAEYALSVNGICDRIKQCPNGKVDRCGVCDGSNSCLDCAGTPNGGAKLDCCGVCGGDGTTCLDKCTFYDLTTTKKRVTGSIAKLLGSVKKYSRQELHCSKGKALSAQRRITYANELFESSSKLLTEFVADKVKSCNTEFCAKRSIESILETIKKNTRTLYTLSKRAQYAAGRTCKVGKRRAPTKSKSAINFRNVTGGLGEVPDVSCVN